MHGAEVIWVKVYSILTVALAVQVTVSAFQTPILQQYHCHGELERADMSLE